MDTIVFLELSISQEQADLGKGNKSGKVVNRSLALNKILISYFVI